MRGIYLQPLDLMKLEDRPSKKACHRIYAIIKAALDKKGRQQMVTLNEYAKYRGVDLKEVLDALQNA